MYTYVKPIPIIIQLNDSNGYSLRKKASDFIKQWKSKGRESGSQEEQSYGILAEMTIRDVLKLPDKTLEDPISYDIRLPSGVKVDVKCRGGVFPFKELYEGKGGIFREAKHNLWARQLLVDHPHCDMYLLTHLQTPKKIKGKSTLPGTKRQKTWFLYVCGWVSTERAKKEGVYLPPGSLTEQGQKWFPYRAHEVEYYHHNLNGLKDITDLNLLDSNDIKKDADKTGSLNLTSIDALRITIDLIGRGILDKDKYSIIQEKLNINDNIPPFFHPNQYFHLIRWLISQEIASINELTELEKIMKEEIYEG